MSYFVVIFKNTYDAMAGENKFKELEYSYKVMPTPTLAVLSCGICLRIEDEEIINKLIQEKFINYKNIFKKEDGQFKIIN